MQVLCGKDLRRGEDEFARQRAVEGEECVASEHVTHEYVGAHLHPNTKSITLTRLYCIGIYSEHQSHECIHLTR